MKKLPRVPEEIERSGAAIVAFSVRLMMTLVLATLQ